MFRRSPCQLPLIIIRKLICCVNAYDLLNEVQNLFIYIFVSVVYINLSSVGPDIRRFILVLAPLASDSE